MIEKPLDCSIPVTAAPQMFDSCFVWISLGEIKLSTIQKNVKRVMREDFSLFSLGIGFDVDYDFLERIAMENRGMAQRIYANHDAAEQLRVQRRSVWFS